MNTRSTLVLSLAMFAGLAASPVLAQPAGHDHQQPVPAKTEAPKDGKDQKPEKAAADKRVGDPYPLTTCPITGEKLGSMGEPIVKLYDGREVRFCCKSCPPKFEKDLAASFAKLDEQVIKDQGSIYPLKTSVVTGKDLPAATIDAAWKNLSFTNDPLAASAQKAADDAKDAGLIKSNDIDGIYDLAPLNAILKAKGEDQVKGS